MNKRIKGKDKEELAAKFLENKGYYIVETNFRVRQAEIDIVARNGSTIVFVEVKYRSSEKNGNPLEAVDIRKQRQISKAALFYLNSKKISVDTIPIRFDVVGILGEDITHIENAFDYIG